MPSARASAGSRVCTDLISTAAVKGGAGDLVEGGERPGLCRIRAAGVYPGGWGSVRSMDDSRAAAVTTNLSRAVDHLGTAAERIATLFAAGRQAASNISAPSSN